MPNTTNGGVRAWEDTIVIPTYAAPAPDRNPMFLEKRVYQGSSGKVYPNPFTDSVSDRKEDRSYTAVHLENEFIRLMILPEIGGRIHIGQHKSNGYDFFYRQHVIKPALVGLLGPWISGGVEFNWPQHHRPSTFMPVDWYIEAGSDGSRTVWLSEHEPMNRMKGMVGICLYPAKSIVEAKVRLFNRTPFVQTFLWWANVGVHVDEHYQAFFPPDVEFVADHAKRAMSWYPVARNVYYGVDYTHGVDISWYKNIPVPTSYMVLNSGFDFFGGYDHAKRAGLVHVADRHVAPGKKLWTWGNAEFGYAWDRELTDNDGPYIELMAGVFTDNQPDFSFLSPYETRSFSQYWFPIRDVGPVKNANVSLAVNLEQDGDEWVVSIYATESLGRVLVVLTAGAGILLNQSITLQADACELLRVPRNADVREADLLLRILSERGRELIRYHPPKRERMDLPAPARPAPQPEEIASADELYVTGLHLEQHRHATRRADTYWLEALKRDPDDARSNNALGLLRLRRGEFAAAEQHFRRAIQRLTALNPNPRDGEPFYNLGLALFYQRRFEEAYSGFYKAVWNRPWQSPAYFSLAYVDSRRCEFELALTKLQASLEADPGNLKARALRTALLRRLQRHDEASASAVRTLQMDPLDHWSRWERVLLADIADRPAFMTDFFRDLHFDAETCLDIAYDYAGAGLFAEAEGLLSRFAETAPASIHPMVFYSMAWFAAECGAKDRSQRYLAAAAQASPDYCFPARLEEMLALEAALAENPDDPRAHYYLGNLLYDKDRKQEAIAHWEWSVRIDPAFSIPWRNLGISYFNVCRDAPRALNAYDTACGVNPSDARLLYEFDQLRKRTGARPEVRLELLESRRDVVSHRDDLTLELLTLYNQMRRYEDALELLQARRFHPWEGGEGLVSGQYVIAHFMSGVRRLDAGDARGALAHFEAARSYPENLGEGKHLLTDERHIDYYTGESMAALGDAEAARSYWTKAAQGGSSEMFAYYGALALRALGREAEATVILRDLERLANASMTSTVTIDYFATSLPNFLLFEDDLDARNRVEQLYLRALARIGLGAREEAACDLRAVLKLDPNHVWADDQLRRVEAAREFIAQ